MAFFLACGADWDRGKPFLRCAYLFHSSNRSERISKRTSPSLLQTSNRTVQARACGPSQPEFDLTHSWERNETKRSSRSLVTICRIIYVQLASGVPIAFSQRLVIVSRSLLCGSDGTHSTRALPFCVAAQCKAASSFRLFTCADLDSPFPASSRCTQ